MGSAVPTVSVGFPVYNGENYMVSSLRELTQQDYEDFELIICDNASTDRTEEIGREFAAKDPRVRYVRNEKNIGLAANHNRTVELARGRFFKWAAHDDSFPRGMLKGFMQAYEEVPANVCLIYSICEFIDESGVSQGVVESDNIGTNHPRPHQRLAHALKNLHMYNSIYGLMRSEVLRKTRLLGLFPISDHVLMAEMAMLGMVVELQKPLVRIRKHRGRSFTAHTTAAARRKLFDPERTQRLSFLSLWQRVYLELLRGAMRIPENPADRALCAVVAAGVPPWMAFKNFGAGQKRKLRRLVSRRSSPAPSTVGETGRS